MPARVIQFPICPNGFGASNKEKIDRAMKSSLRFSRALLPAGRFAAVLFEGVDEPGLLEPPIPGLRVSAYFLDDCVGDGGDVD